MKRIIIPILFAQSFNGLAFAQELAPQPQVRNVAESLADQAKNYIEEQGRHLVQTADLILSIDLPDLNLGPIHLGAGLKTGEKPILGSAFTAVDGWRVTTGFATPGKTSISVEAQRELYYIRQEPSVTDGIKRNAKDFDFRRILPDSIQKAVAMKSGDLVVYEAPFVFKINQNFLTQATKETLKNLRGDFYVHTNMIMHVFKMDNNRIRVRLLTSKSQGGEFFYGLANPLQGSIPGLLKNAISFHPLDGFVRKDYSDLVSLDYIFNLNDPSAQQMYQNLAGSKFTILSKKISYDKTILADKNALINSVYADLIEIDKMAKEDQQKQPEAARIVRLQKGEINSNSTTFGIEQNILNAIGFRAAFGSTTEAISLTNRDGDIRNYSHEKDETSYKFKFFDLWKSESRKYSGLLISYNKNNKKPKDIVGLTLYTMKDQPNFTAADAKRFKRSLEKSIPQKIYRNLDIPEVDMGRTHLEYSALFTKNAFKALRGVGTKTVKENLISLIQNSNLSVDVKPSELMVNSVSDDNTSRLQQVRADFNASLQDNSSAGAARVRAFESDINLISNSLTTIFEKTSDANPVEMKLKAYDVIKNNTLFQELGYKLLVQSIPEESLEKSLLVSLKISSQNKTVGVGGIKDSFFPSDLYSVMTEENELNQVISRLNNMTNSDAFSLRLYYKENGEAKPLETIIKESSTPVTRDTEE